MQSFLRSRTALFVNGKLAIVKVMKRDMFVNENTFSVLQNKLDTVYSRTQKPIIFDNDGTYWDYGGGNIVSSGPAGKIHTDVRDFSKFVWSIGIVVSTPAANSMAQK